MGETANPQSSAEFAQYMRNAFKCLVMLGSLLALINTCKLTYFPGLSHVEGGGDALRQRQSAGQSELNLLFAHEWTYHLCLPGATWWGSDKDCRVAEWRICKVRTELQHQDSSAWEFPTGEKEQSKYLWCTDTGQRFLQHINPHSLHISRCIYLEGKKWKV